MVGMILVSAAFVFFGAPGNSGDWDAPGEGSIGIALDRGLLWVADRKAVTATALDPLTGAAVRTVKLPCRETGGLAAGEGKLWCSEVLQNLLFEVDAATGMTSKRMEAPCDYPGALAYEGGLLWVHCPFEKKISVTDPADGTTLRWVPAVSRRMSALGAGGGYVLAADKEKDRVFMLDPERGNVLAVLQAGSPNVTGLAFDGRRLYTVDYLTDRGRTLDLDKSPPFAIEGSQDASVTFRHHVLSGGPAPLTDVNVFVALPEDRITQKVHSLVPLPPGADVQEVADKQGQRFWKFHLDQLPAGQEATFGYTADVTLKTVRWFTDPRRSGTAKDIPADIRAKYLGDGTKYQVKDPAVVAAARGIAGESRNLHLVFQRTYRFVLDNMDYALSGGWNAAPLLLERKNGSCSEYTFLLIALLRASGIPARYVGSLVMRGDPASVDLVFHRWAEAYLPGLGWFPVDANRGDTEWPSDQADGFGFQDGVFLVTTESSGDSDILEWGYNSVARYRHEGPAEVREWTSAEWEPPSGDSGGAP
jgi:transglutaminase-like putative cysteine protease